MRTTSLAAAFRFPLQGSRFVRPLLLAGGVGVLLELVFTGLAALNAEDAALGVAPLALVLNLPALGYLLALYDEALRGKREALPEWAAWPGLLRRGLVALAILVAYGLGPLLVMLFGLGWLVRGGRLMVPGLILIVAAVVAGLIMLFFLPMALARYLLEQRLESAFHLGRLWGAVGATLIPYLRAYLISVGSAVVAGVLAALPYLGLLVWPFLWFYLAVVQARLFAEACAPRGRQP